MIPSIAYLENKFVYFNNLIFNDQLPLPNFKLLKSQSMLGKFQYRKNIQPHKCNFPQTCTLAISALIDFNETLLDDTIIHEMIHYYIWLNGIKDDSTHGRSFKTIMQQINNKFHRRISISHKYTDEELHQLRSIPKIRLLCLTTLNDNKNYIKAVPRIDIRIKQIHKQIKLHFPTKNVRWFFTDDPFFNNLPVSSAIKLYPISNFDIYQHLPVDREVTSKIQKIL